jgi:hypothetical protein
MGYPAKKRQPAAIAPSAQATSPFMKCVPSNTTPFSAKFHLLLTPDGEVRAKELAIATINTHIRLDHHRKMVAMLIEFFGYS